MYTVEGFMNIATEAERVYLARLEQYPAGTVDRIRNDARKTMDTALLAADYMEKNGIETANGIGSFNCLKLKKGMKVRIKKGAVYTSMNPSLAGSQVNKLNRVITIHNVYEGYIPFPAGSYPHRNPSITWAGAGGYWCETEINNIEIIEE